MGWDFQTHLTGGVVFFFCLRPVFDLIGWKSKESRPGWLFEALHDDVNESLMLCIKG